MAEKRKFRIRIAYFLIVIFLCLTSLEIGLRAVKSLMLDGVFHVKTPSVNNRMHARYGWISPSLAEYEKTDACYGTGVVSYNEAGFRAPPMRRAVGSEPLVCILGDSTMQGYQLPDGKYLPHLLAKELRHSGHTPFVLPLAVGGYGSAQQWLLFEDYCEKLDPDVVIWHWAHNDPENNSYLADRNSGPNNVRPRPYYEDGDFVIRRPYPIKIHDSFDTLLTMKMLNGLILRFTEAPVEELIQYLETGWLVAEELADKVSKSVDNKIALVEATELRAIEMFRKLGYEVAVYEAFPDEYRCLPQDYHPNTLGHQYMLDALMPVFQFVLQRPESSGV